MPDERFDRDLMPLLRPHVERWLTAHPSTTMLDPADYLRLSEKLAVNELESAPLTPLGENNTLVRAWHEPRLEIFGVEEMVEAQASYNAASLRTVIDAAALKASDQNALYLRLIEMMALTGNLVPKHGLPRSFVSYRSHAEYFFANYDSGGAYRARLAAVDAQLGPRIDAIIAAAHRIFLGEETPKVHFPHLAGWYRDCKALSLHVYGLAERHADLLGEHNRLGGLADEVVGALNMTLDPEKARKTSDLETYIGDMPTLFKHVPHIAYRTMVNFLYGLLPILSVPPMQKYALCHLVANGCERVFGKGWRQVVDEGRGALQPVPGAGERVASVVS